MWEIVVYILLAHPDVPADWLPDDAVPAIEKVAIDLDLVGDNATFTASAPVEMEWLRAADYACRDCPRSWDCVLLPERKRAQELHAAGVFHLARLEEIAARSEWTGQVYAPWVEEQRQRVRIWDEVLIALDVNRCKRYRRQALGALRTMIGDEAYYLGEIPPPIVLEALERR